MYIGWYVGRPYWEIKTILIKRGFEMIDSGYYDAAHTKGYCVMSNGGEDITLKTNIIIGKNGKEQCSTIYDVHCNTYD